MAERDETNSTPGDAALSPENNAPATPPPAAKPATSSVQDALAQEALRAAQEAIASLASDVNSAMPAASPDLVAEAVDEASAAAPLELPVFTPSAEASHPKGIDLLSDVNLNVKIELGRTRMFVEDVLKLSEGAIVELDKLAGDPVDIFVNDRPIARGEVLVLNDNFCVRINEILHAGADERAAG